MLRKNSTREIRIGFLALTPPLEALRLIISDAATRDQEEDKVLTVNDVDRAFFLYLKKRHILEMTSDFCYKAFTGPGMRAPTSRRRSGRC